MKDGHERREAKFLALALPRIHSTRTSRFLHLTNAYRGIKKKTIDRIAFDLGIAAFPSVFGTPCAFPAVPADHTLQEEYRCLELSLGRIALQV